MTVQLEFYRARAAEAQALAASATLQNIRDRWLLAVASWTDLADRAERSEKLHQKLIGEKAIERAAATSRN